MLGLAAATSSPALAESGGPDVPVLPVPDVAAAAAAVLEDTGLTQVVPATAVAPLDALPAVPAPTTAAEPVTEGAVAAPPPAPAVEAPVEAVAEAIPAPLPAAATVDQTAPANVNVSIRVDSPGENGAVTQLNVVASLSADAAAATSQYQQPQPRYQAPIPAPATPARPSAATPVAGSAGDTATAAPAAGEWTWTWNCIDEIPAVPVDAGMFWNWNWNWNCDEESPDAENTLGNGDAQYQPSVTQYRPININVSIRINSPGSDGPVLQANVAVAVTPPALPALPLAAPGQPAPGIEGAQGSAQADAAASSQAEAPAPAAADPAEQGSEAECCVLPAPRGTTAPGLATESVLLRGGSRAVRRDITVAAGIRPSLEATVRLAARVAAADPASRASRKPVRMARPAPPHLPADPGGTPELAVAGVAFAPLADPGGRPGSFLVLLMAIGLAFAFADAARSVAAEVRAAAAADPGRPPDHPG